MKRKFLFSLAFLAFAVIISAFTYQNNQLPDMPTYKSSMNKVSSNSNLIVSCNGQSWFGSCSAMCPDGYACSCQTGIFECNCACTPMSGGGRGPGDTTIGPAQISLLSVSEQQYENWKKLASTLKSLDSEASKQSYLLLVDMAQNLQKEDAKNYNENAKKFENSLKNLNLEEINILNAFFAKEKANFKI